MRVGLTTSLCDACAAEENYCSIIVFMKGATANEVDRTPGLQISYPGRQPGEAFSLTLSQLSYVRCVLPVLCALPLL